MQPTVHQGKRGIQFAVRVAPRSSRNGVAGVYGEAIKVRLTAPPVEGAANQALVEFIAAALGVPHSNVEIVAGHTGKNKVLSVSGLSEDEVRARLAALLSGTG